MSDTTDLAVLANEPETVTVGGKKLVVNRIRVKQIARVLTLVQPMAHLIIKKDEKIGSGAITKKAKAGIDIPALIIAHSDDLVQLIAEIQSYGNEGVTAQWVEDLEIDEMITLTGAVLEVNLDFFIQKVIPAMSEALLKLNGSVSKRIPTGLAALQS